LRELFFRVVSVSVSNFRMQGAGSRLQGAGVALNRCVNYFSGQYLQVYLISECGYLEVSYDANRV